MLQPLIHYLLECPETGHLLPNLDGLPESELIMALQDEAMVRLVQMREPAR